jgi:PII-like signaling protein
MTLPAGKALKVSIYLSEGATYHGSSAYSSILDYLFFHGISGATVLKGIAGFGSDHHLHSAGTVEISDKLPVKIEFIESESRVEEILPRLRELAGTAMIEVQETTVVKTADVPKPAKQPAPQHVKIEGRAKLMQIFIGESDRWQGKPLHAALVQAMRAHDLAGATVHRGILGYGAHRRVHKDKPFHLSGDASLTITVVDTEEKLKAFLPVVDQMVAEGLVTLSDADIIKYAHRAEDV